LSENKLKRLCLEFETKLKLVQLIGENRCRLSEMDFNHLLTAEGLAEVATDADGIGAWIKQIVSGNSFLAILS